MKTKEAIEFTEDVKREYTVCPTRYQTIIKKYDGVIDLLKRGEKFEKMWKELREDYGEYRINCEHIDDVGLEKVMDNYKKKYFPKEE